MTVRRKVVRKRTPATQSGTTQRKSLPAKPKVTLGPKCYGEDIRGRRIVIRFWVTDSLNPFDRKSRRSGRWFVVDQDIHSRSVAAGTKREGYVFEEAVKVARRYRDEFGAYCKFPY